MQPQQQQLQLKASDDDLKGRFSNAANVNSQEDHFYIDFFVAAVPAGQLVSRVFMTPGHMKRLHKAMSDQIDRYENTFGKIDPADEPKLGFKTPN